MLGATLARQSTIAKPRKGGYAKEFLATLRHWNGSLIGFIIYHYVTKIHKFYRDPIKSDNYNKRIQRLSLFRSQKESQSDPVDATGGEKSNSMPIYFLRVWSLEEGSRNKSRSVRGKAETRFAPFLYRNYEVAAGATAASRRHPASNSRPAASCAARKQIGSYNSRCLATITFSLQRVQRSFGEGRGRGIGPRRHKQNSRTVTRRDRLIFDNDENIARSRYQKRSRFFPFSSRSFPLPSYSFEERERERELFNEEKAWSPVSTIGSLFRDRGHSGGDSVPNVFMKICLYV